LTVIHDICDQQFASINDLFQAIGTSLLKSMGGASGVLYATLFVGGLADEQKTDRFTTDFFNKTFSKAFKVMKIRGRSMEGQKTLLDTIGPATRELTASASAMNPLSITVAKTAEAAYEGCMNTCNMIAGCGRSRKLGEAALGVPDPGAVSSYILFASIDEYVNGNKAKEINFRCYSK
ncbi:MAG: dihydroxyacetone kinase subunit L, partial [Smithella sp.]